MHEKPLNLQERDKGGGLSGHYRGMKQVDLVWSSDDLVIAGHSYPGFPILLWDSMESCIVANQFSRHYLLRGAIGSKKSWPSTGCALYDYFSFLQAHELDWRDVDRGEAKRSAPSSAKPASLPMSMLVAASPWRTM